MKYIRYSWSGMGYNYYGFKAVCPKCGHTFLDYTGVRITGAPSNFCPDCGEKQDNSYETFVDALTEALRKDHDSDDEIENEISRLLKESRLAKKEE